MSCLEDYFKLLKNVNEDLELEESAKTDFIAKFGQETFNNFEKAKQRLINNGYSIDFGQYLSKDKREVDDLILSLYNKKTIKGTMLMLGNEKHYKINKEKLKGSITF